MTEHLDSLRAAPAYAGAAQESRASRVIAWLARHWLLAFGTLWGLYVGLPWLAPVLMKLGATGAGSIIYLVYSTQCHQLPERSYFLFGPKFMYPLPAILSAWPYGTDPTVLRQFIGNSAMGWKVAWSDRMVSLYTAVFAGAVLYGLFRRRIRRLPLWGLVLAALPVGLDGGTHFLSDLFARSVVVGFRDSNAWLAALTGNNLPSWFYAGDALGSFNWWMRLLTGVIFGLALVWALFPMIEESAREIVDSARHGSPGNNA